MTKFIVKQFEANLKANMELITICATLTDEQLAVEVEGIFGQIKPLLVHIIQGEGNALRDLSGVPPWADDIDWDSLSFEQLLEMAQQSGTALLEYATHTDPDKAIHFEDDDEEADFKAWVLINAEIHHGIEHRTQIHALLTKLGVPHLRQDVWSFADSVGELKIVEKSKPPTQNTDTR